MNITVNASVIANAGIDKLVCGNSAVILGATSASGGNWTGGTGTFNPNSTTANAAYTPSVSEIGSTVTLIWNIPDPDGAGPCTASSDAMTITVNTSTVANAGTDKAICGVSTTTLSANAVTGGNWTGGAGTFSPSRMQPMQFILL
jgi:hypothetical protein